MLLFLVSSEHWLVKYHSRLVRPLQSPSHWCPSFAVPLAGKGQHNLWVLSPWYQPIYLPEDSRSSYNTTGDPASLNFLLPLCSLAPYSHLAPPSLRLHFFISSLTKSYYSFTPLNTPLPSSYLRGGKEERNVTRTHERIKWHYYYSLNPNQVAPFNRVSHLIKGLLTLS